MKLERNIDVLVLGYYGFGNLGDELLSKSIVDNLVTCGVSQNRIVLLSANPPATEALTGVKAYNRWNLGTVSALMKQSKTFLFGGGGLFQDVTSVKSCGYYWWIARSAKMSGAKIWAVSQSVGPLNKTFGKYFAKSALKSCKYISVRDDNSAGLLDSWKIKYEKHPDAVLGIALKKCEGKGNALLLNLRPCYNEVAETAIRQAKSAAKREGLKITAVAFAAEDAVYLENLQAAGKINFSKTVTVKSAEDFENAACGAAKAIGMRLHFAELCALSQLPVAMAAYDPKVASFCREWNIPLLGSKISDSFAVADKERLKICAADIAAGIKNGLNTVLDCGEMTDGH